LRNRHRHREGGQRGAGGAPRLTLSLSVLGRADKFGHVADELALNASSARRAIPSNRHWIIRTIERGSRAGHPSVPLLNELLRGSKIASLTGRQDLVFVADDHPRPDGVFVVPTLAHRGPEMT
jgi:hypothetical protein